MTSSRSLGCCRSKTWRITSRIGACQACLQLMFMFTDVCACEISRGEVNEACRCACPDGIAPSKISTSDDAYDDHFLISAKSETLLSRPLSAPRPVFLVCLPISPVLRTCSDSFFCKHNRIIANSAVFIFLYRSNLICARERDRHRQRQTDRQRTFL